jgi:hypothetical protein
MKIAEPRWLTDWMLAAFTAWLASPRQVYRLKDRAANLWLAAFCAVAASAFVGGLARLLRSDRSEPRRRGLPPCCSPAPAACCS